jgi:hypothetical protein
LLNIYSLGLSLNIFYDPGSWLKNGDSPAMFTGIMKPAYADSSNSGFTSNNQEEDNSTNEYGAMDFVSNLNDAVDVGKWMIAGVAGLNGLHELSSGAAMLSGLAGAGGDVGGGAVAGIGVLGTAPVIAAQAVMDKVLRDDDRLPSREREARGVGRAMIAVGTVAGTTGTVGTIAAAGSVAGLSGAGITSGLAAIGSVVGGGMSAGIALTVAAPAVATIAVSYGTYKIWQHMTKE